MTRSEIREERRARSAARRRRRRAILTAAGLIFALVFIAGLVLTPGLLGRNNDPGGLNTGGPVALDPNDGTNHIAPGVQHAPYSVRPATSGTHWFVAPNPNSLAPHGAPARWGEYTDVLPDEVLVHNLEHGGIGLHYDCPDGCADVVEQLRQFPPGSHSQFIISPYPGLVDADGNPKRIAVTAWRHHMFLDEVDVAKIREFIDAYQDRAPESVPGNSF